MKSAYSSCSSSETGVQIITEHAKLGKNTSMALIVGAEYELPAHAHVTNEDWMWHTDLEAAERGTVTLFSFKATF